VRTRVHGHAIELDPKSVADAEQYIPDVKVRISRSLLVSEYVVMFVFVDVYGYVYVYVYVYVYMGMGRSPPRMTCCM